MVTRGPVPTNRRSMVMPMTPPLAASLRIAASVLQRALRGTSARQFEWVTRTGFAEASITSSVVRSPQCEISTAMPSWFIRARTLSP